MLMRERDLRSQGAAPRALGWRAVRGRGYANTSSHSLGTRVGKIVLGGAMQIRSSVRPLLRAPPQGLVLVGGAGRLPRGRI